MEATTLMDWLVDTNILIDHLRGVSKATTFLQYCNSEPTILRRQFEVTDAARSKLNG
jgi:predicted nucleic acid-binding protein